MRAVRLWSVCTDAQANKSYMSQAGINQFIGLHTRLCYLSHMTQSQTLTLVSCGVKGESIYIVCANSEGYVEYAYLRGLSRAFVGLNIFY